MSEQRQNGADLAQLEAHLGLTFHNRTLLRTAFVHRSYLNEAGEGVDLQDNERMEFLGDAILSFIVSEHLYRQYPQHQEGDLTRLRSALVRRDTLAHVAGKLRLGDYLLLGRGEEENGGRTRLAILCAVFEALIGAIFLDQGIEVTRRFALDHLRPELEFLEVLAMAKDAKSRLQELAQGWIGETPRYKTFSIEGPDHARFFTQVVTIRKQTFGVGRGNSKQDADQAAAAMALHRLGQPAPEHVPNDALAAQFDLAPAELLGPPPATE